jgi:hypothetical protein
MPADKFLISNETNGLEPLLVTIAQTEHLTGESRSQIYNRIGCGEYEAVKSGRRTLITYGSIKHRIAALPRAKIRPPKPRKRWPATAPGPS